MKLSAGVLAEAQARAAHLWGADVCRFSTGGATHANQALALAVGGEGKTVVVSRTPASFAAARTGACRPDTGVGAPRDGRNHGSAAGVAPESVAAALAAPGGKRGLCRRSVLRRHDRGRARSGAGGPRP